MTTSLLHAGGSPPETSPGAPDHDANALAVVKRFLDGEATTLPMGNQPLEPRIEGDTKVFELTIDRIDHRIDALKDPIAALGYNGVWPGPRLTVVEGDTVRAVFTNNLDETTGVHFHGQRVPNPMDGVPHITQEPIRPGESFTYEFVVRVPGSHMYHSTTMRPTRSVGGCWAPSSSNRAIRPRVTTAWMARARTSSGSATTRSGDSPSTAVASQRLLPSSRRWATRSSSGS